MDSDEITWIVVAVALVLALIALAFLLARLKQAKKTQERRERAGELRTEADQHAHALPTEELRAREEKVRAERLRLEAQQAEAQAHEAETGYLQEAARHEDRLREADRLDPDGPSGSDRRDDSRTGRHAAPPGDGVTDTPGDGAPRDRRDT